MNSTNNNNYFNNQLQNIMSSAFDPLPPPTSMTTTTTTNKISAEDEQTAAEVLSSLFSASRNNNNNTNIHRPNSRITTTSDIPPSVEINDSSPEMTSSISRHRRPSPGPLTSNNFTTPTRSSTSIHIPGGNNQQQQPLTPPRTKKFPPRWKVGTGRTRRKTSKYVGVSWNRTNVAWQALVPINRKYKFVGYFAGEDEAAKAYDIASILWCGTSGAGPLNFGTPSLEEVEEFRANGEIAKGRLFTNKKPRLVTAESNEHNHLNSANTTTSSSSIPVAPSSSSASITVTVDDNNTFTDVVDAHQLITQPTKRLKMDDDDDDADSSSLDKGTVAAGNFTSDMQLSPVDYQQSINNDLMNNNNPINSTSTFQPQHNNDVDDQIIQ
jgi:hypothetical protein